ncbi:hypothetical protein BCV69DRAFT_211818 [Microstroma glucosiphilum]|uniref:Uncharacterized protein n=1 Tax=Pseudomicrostroma glucosiphilum TaxID=1684307 RepID=A0A316U5K6_9BASI|nr:hypothetical protein BCV69DRAFT_211818 [Pseudomicrostroma glucosiphilum]PWN20516.1 hypothetical protein BCV69DRAFT_211818 [Pseudomicrostroma glucosiphilum]
MSRPIQRSRSLIACPTLDGQVRYSSFLPDGGSAVIEPKLWLISSGTDTALSSITLSPGARTSGDACSGVVEQEILAVTRSADEEAVVLLVPLNRVGERLQSPAFTMEGMQVSKSFEVLYEKSSYESRGEERMGVRVSGEEWSRELSPASQRISLFA